MARILIGLMFAMYALAQMPAGDGPMGSMGPGGPMGPPMTGMHMMGPRGEMGPPEELKDFLGLDDKQVESLQQIAKKAHESMRSASETMRTKQQQLRDQIEKATDPAAAGKLLFEIEAQRKAMPTIRQKAHADALAVLNETQKAKLKELRKENAERAAARQALGLNLINAPMFMGPQGPMIPGGQRQGQGRGFRQGPGMGPGQGPGGPMPEPAQRPE